ncbi:MAG TPA: DUF2752 domain-containing protein [Thermoanaerobaculia bacterium]|nr:DUF2752 domain-containing protein [Thermoanaerobaculia bacterium]HSN88660.1 DUF2752 domain-containing protein [Thermoanaerobaculia bacterium]
MAAGAVETPLTSFLRSRPTAAFLAAIAGVQLALVAFGLPGWPCPLLSGLGIPCPGCGLSRAVIELLRGDWRGALELHAFSPVFLAAIIMILGMSLLPEKTRLPMIQRIERVERRTGFSALLLVGLLLYWAFRWASEPAAYLALVGG